MKQDASILPAKAKQTDGKQVVKLRKEQKILISLVQRRIVFKK